MVTSSTPTVSIVTLGDCQMSVDGHLVKPPVNYLRFLVYVLLEGRGKPVLRRRVGDLIWSDGGAEQASADIRQSLVRIRRFQDENNLHLLATDPNMVWLNLNENVHFDLAEFVELVANPTPKAWVRLCEIYNGELLGSLRAAGEGFEEWLSYKRSGLRYDFVSAISRAVLPDSPLTAHHRQFCAKLLLQVDPYHEGGHRALMYDAAANRQFSSLRQIYEECARRLRNELGVDPDEETVRLYQRLITRAPAN